MIKKISAFAGVFVALFAYAGVAQSADDIVFTLINNTKGTLERFYTSPEGVDSWEEDVFGDDVLEPGQSIRITIRDGRRSCKYDMRFEFSEDSRLENMEDTQDICQMASYTLHQ